MSRKRKTVAAPVGAHAVADQSLRAIDIQPAPLTSKSERLSISNIRTLLELHDNGARQVDIAAAVGCSQGTVSRILSQFAGTAEQVAKQLRTLTDESIQDWRNARKVAAKRGDHRPARELLEAAYPDLRPQHAAANGAGGVTVIVAVPNSQDNPRPVITVNAPQFTTVEPN